MYLNTHSQFSLRYGVLSVDDILSWAQAAGVTRVALTDVGTTSANWDFVRRAEGFGVAPVLGIDVRNGNARRFVALARDAAGYAALCRWFSDLNLAGASFPARLPEAVRAAGVAAIYPWAAWREAHDRKARDPSTDPSDAAPLGTDEWVGVQAWEIPAVRLARADRDPVLGPRLVALSTATFTCKRDWNTHRLLRAVDLNTLLSRLDAAECGDPRDCFRAPEELRAAYVEMPELVARAENLLAGCSMELPEPPEGRLHNNPHTYTGSEDEDEALVRALCAEGLAYRYPNHDDAVLERMEHEIGLIRKQGFLAYFLVNWDITSYARSRGYFHVGRGSGANSLVAYLLRITDVDPIELDLYFERFLNLYRANPPDFDIDFSWTDRDDVVAYMFQRFPNVALLAAYNTFQYRAAVRELGKVMGLPKHEIDALCAGQFNPNRLGEMETVVLKYAAVIRDFPSSLTLHACGVLIAHDDIHRYGALFMPPKGLRTVMFDMVVAEDVGLHKFDILSQRGLGKIKDALEMVRARDPETAAEIDIHDMRRFKADEGVRAMLREARATGCFYVESPAMRMLMRKLQVDDYLGLVAASSVIRPGVARSGMMQAYIERHRDPARRAEAHPVLLHLMPETYGVMVYQEDVIKVAHRFAGLDLGEADVLRRGMSGKFRSREEFDRARDAFHTKAVAKGHAPDLVREVWRQMESFAGYAFAKGHSASYAVESYQSLFLKVHFPLEYMCACINNFGGFYRTEFYVHEARMLGARIAAPCVNTVGALAVADPHSQTLTLGFNLVKDLNGATVASLERARAEGGPFASLVDLVERIAPSLEQLTILIRVGALRFTGATKHVLLWEAHFLLAAEAQGGSSSARAASRNPAHVADLLAGRRALPARSGAGTGELFPPPKPRTYVLPPLDAAPLADAFDEWELLGFPLCSPFLLLTEEAKAVVRSGVLARDLPDRIGDVVTVVGHLVTVKETATAKGERMCFGCFVDLEGAWLDTVHFPGVARDFPFRGRGVYAVRGTVSESFGCVNVDVQRMERLATLPDPRYAENGVLPAGLESGISSRRRQPPKSASAPGFRGAFAPASVP
jgi:DNA polymerase-3 subunit alpha